MEGRCTKVRVKPRRIKPKAKALENKNKHAESFILFFSHF